jgi:molybdopterin-guanine dinucleotide biosynthesis protein MobB
MSQSSVPVIGLVAASGTGKTTLLKKLVPVLRERGLRVGYLKHAHHSFDLDRPGKDSYEVREAGADQTLLASSERWALQSAQREAGRDPSLEEMVARFDQDRIDLILVEGFKFAHYPKIELHRTTLGTPLLYPKDPDIVAVVSDHSLPGDDHPPVLPPGDPAAIADFIARYLASAAPPGPRLRGELVRYYRLLHVHRCNDSHSGNASVRDGDGFWVTRRGACADTLVPRELVFCPLEGGCPEGASSDAATHAEVYRRRPEARAMLHSHGPYSVAMSFAGQDFRPADFEARHYFELVPVLNVPFETYAEEAPAAVAEALAEHPVCMVRGHGVYAWGESLDLAYKWTTSLELSAKTFVIARQAASV